MLIVNLCFVCEPPYEDNFNLRLLPTDLILICSRQLLTPPALTKTKSEANQAFSKSRRDRGENPLVSRSLETRKLKDWLGIFHSLQILSAILTLHYNRVELDRHGKNRFLTSQTAYCSGITFAVINELDRALTNKRLIFKCGKNNQYVSNKRQGLLSVTSLCLLTLTSF